MEDLRAFLAQHPYFRELDGQRLLGVARLATVRHLARDEILGLEGDPPSAVYFVIRGSVRALKVSPQGREQLISLHGPGDPFYLVPALDGDPLPVTTQAAVECVLLAFPRDDFMHILHVYPSVTAHVLSALAHRLRQMSALVEDLALRTVPQRLDRLLIQKVQTPRAAAAGQRMTQREMAAQLGTVREVVARALRDLETRGLIHVHRGVIEIIDPAGLEAASSPSV